MSNLTCNGGPLEKLDQKVEGMYGKPEHVWRLRPDYRSTLFPVDNQRMFGGLQ